MDFEELLKETYHIDDNIFDIARQAEDGLAKQFDFINNNKQYNQIKVLRAMQNAGLSDRHFNGTTGYGYDDIGRDALDRIYAEVFGCEDALVRSQIISGTQALAICLFGILRPGDELISVTGKPYDTLEEVIGIRHGEGSLKEFGIIYSQVDLKEDGSPDYDAIYDAVNNKTKLVEIQRSRGYSERTSLSVETIGKIISIIKSKNPNTLVMVDNCYGEFVEKIEPTQVGADLIAGSLIKNPGGGLAQSGGYIAGTAKCVELCAQRLTCPGLGKHVGASLQTNRNMIQGFYMAPHIVAESLKGAVFMASLFEKLGYETSPKSNDKRSDIVQTIKFNNEDNLKEFCRAIQAAAPVDSFVIPEAWDMPGYDNPVIMAAGAFVQGASIELSADGPMIPPYIAFMQGGLVYENVKVAAMMAADRILKKG